jgi:hypothetical protein
MNMLKFMGYRMIVAMAQIFYALLSLLAKK